MPATDRFDGREPESLLVSIADGEAVTPHNSNEFGKVSRALYVGVGGDVVVVLKSDAQLTLKNVGSGALLPLRAKRVHATGTTATDIVALY